jgi:hypothetical protein
MNTDTGVLRRIVSFGGGNLGANIAKAAAAGFTPVPKKHEAEAEKHLDGKDSALVDLKANSPLANWAREERRHSKCRKAKTKMAKASKRRNRA